MPQSFVSLHCHIVFSTKHRAPLIQSPWAQRLYDYMGGIARKEESCLVAAGGMPDHVHLLISLGKQCSIAGVARSIKAGSSGWVHETFPELAQFAWQTGYGAFAVSVSNLERVRQYIANQPEHHRARTFQEEFLALLRRHGIPCDERYLWD